MSDLSSFLSTIEWQQPWWFLLALQPAILWLILRWISKQSQQDFADEHLLPWVKVPSHKTFWQKIFSRDTAYFLAWIGFALALANPQIPDKKAIDANNTSTDVMLIIDLSTSMNATDIKPSRLRRATLEAYEFLSLARNARVGIVVYAARPHLFVPLTHDFDALRFYLKDLDSLQLPTMGSDPASAIILAQKELMLVSSNNKNIVWITDGDFNEKQLKAVNQAVQHEQIITYVLGIATEEGAAIPLSSGTWLESDGQAVISKPDFGSLEKNIDKWGGVLSTVKDDESDWNRLYQQGILVRSASHANTENAESEEKKQLKTIYPWFLFPALALLLMALFFTSLPSARMLTFIIALLSIIGFTTAKAEENFFNDIEQGAEAYKNQQFGRSRSQFSQAVLNANTAEQRAIALHNLGNALFQNGDYQTATKLFADALRYNPEQSQSSENQQLSRELFQVIQRRIRNAQMQGNLSTPNQNSQLFDLPKQLPSSLSTKAVNTTKFKLPDLPKADVDKLLEKGLAHIQLMQGKDLKNPQQQKEQQDFETARQHLIALSEQGSASSNALWKRLFEIEEGFAGSLKKPEKIPGVKPW